MKLLSGLAVLFSLALLLMVFPVLAQQPIPVATPWYLATAYPGQLPTAHYVPTAPVLWTPWPTMPPPPVYPSPTSTTWNWFAARADNQVPVYTCPSTVCYNIGRLLPGEVVTVRPASPGWLQIESGYLTGSFVRAGDVTRV